MIDKFVSLSLLFSIFFDNVFGFDYYLDSSGSSANDCSQASPCNAWDDVTSLLVDGDNVYVNPDTFINIHTQWVADGIYHFYGLSNINSTLKSNGSSSMTPGSGLFQVTESTENIELYLDNFNIIQEQETIYVRMFKLFLWRKGTFELTNCKIYHQFSWTQISMVYIVGDYSATTNYVNNILIQNIEIYDADTDYTNANIFYTEYAKTLTYDNIKVFNAAFYYFIYSATITSWYGYDFVLSNISCSNQVFQTGYAEYLELDGLTIQNGSSVANQAFYGNQHTNMIFNNFVFRDSVSTATNLVQFIDVTSGSQDGFTIKNSQVQGRALRSSGGTNYTLTRLNLINSVFNAIKTVSSAITLETTINVDVDTVVIDGSTFLLDVFTLDASPRVTVSNVDFRDTTYTQSIFGFSGDTTEFLLNTASFSNLTNGSEPLIDIIPKITYFELTDISIGDVNNAATELDIAVSIDCNGSSTSSSINSIAFTRVTTASELIIIDSCDSLTGSSFSMIESTSTYGIYLIDLISFTISTMTFSANSIGTSELYCENCLNGVIDDFTASGSSGAQNVFEFIISTEVDESVYTSATGYAISVTNSIFSNNLPLNTIGYFSNADSSQIEYLFENVEFNGNSYNGGTTNGMIYVAGNNVKITFSVATFTGNSGWDSVIYCEASSSCEIVIDESRFESNDMNLNFNAIWLADGANGNVTVTNTDFRENSASSEVANYNSGDSTFTFISCTFALLTEEPSQIPSNMPTTIPTRLPSNEPSVVPSTEPTSIPTNVPISPTAQPVPNNVEFVFPDASDLTIVSFGSTTSVGASNDYFNPGFKQAFYAVAELNLDTSAKYDLFSNWMNDNTFADITINFNWTVYQTYPSIVDTSSIEDQYNSISLSTNGDGETGKLRLTTFYKLYAENDVGIMTSAICDTYSNDIFDENTEYDFDVSVTITATDDGSVWSTTSSFEISKEDSMTLTASKQPYGGTCSVDPASGIALLDKFNFTCDGWYALGNVTSNLRYALIYDDSMFVKTYSEDSEFSTVLSSADTTTVTYTVVILDNNTVTASCVDLAISVSDTSTEIATDDELGDTATFTSVLIASVDDVNAETLDEAAISLVAAYNIFVSYAEYYESTFGEGVNITAAVLFHEEIIDRFLQAAANITTYAEAANALATLAAITAPLVDSGSAYSEETILAIMDFLQNVILPIFENSGSTIGQSIVEDILELLANILDLRSLSDESVATGLIVGQSTVDVSLTTTELVVSDFFPGETLYVSNSDLSLESTVFSLDTSDTCGSSSGSIVFLSTEYLSVASDNGTNNMQCSIFTSSSNVYSISNASLNAEALTYTNMFVNVDISGINASSSVASDYLVSECDPIIIQLNSTNASYWANSDLYPECAFFNETTQEYETEGCFVLHSTDDYVQCACVHATFFGIRANDFDPELNYTLEDLYPSLSIGNVISHPLGWIVCLTWIFVCFALMAFCNAVNTKEDTPLVANADAFLDAGTTEHYRVLKEARLFQDNYRGGCVNKICNLWFIALRNDHIWWGICCRHHGTSYSNAQRIAIMMVRLLTTMAITAVFYGVSKDSVIGDLALAFFESLIGFIPMKFIEDCVRLHRPMSSKEIDDDLDDRYQKKINTIRDIPESDLILILKGDKDVAAQKGWFFDDEDTDMTPGGATAGGDVAAAGANMYDTNGTTPMGQQQQQQLYQQGHPTHVNMQQYQLMNQYGFQNTYNMGTNQMGGEDVQNTNDAQYHPPLPAEAYKDDAAAPADGGNATRGAPKTGSDDEYYGNDDDDESSEHGDPAVTGKNNNKSEEDSDSESGHGDPAVTGGAGAEKKRRKKTKESGDTGSGITQSERGKSKRSKRSKGKSPKGDVDVAVLNEGLARGNANDDNEQDILELEQDDGANNQGTGNGIRNGNGGKVEIPQRLKGGGKGVRNTNDKGQSPSSPKSTSTDGKRRKKGTMGDERQGGGNGVVKLPGRDYDAQDVASVDSDVIYGGSQSPRSENTSKGGKTSRKGTRKETGGDGDENGGGGVLLPPKKRVGDASNENDSDDDEDSDVGDPAVTSGANARRPQQQDANSDVVSSDDEAVTPYTTNGTTKSGRTTKKTKTKSDAASSEDSDEDDSSSQHGDPAVTGGAPVKKRKGKDTTGGNSGAKVERYAEESHSRSMDNDDDEKAEKAMRDTARTDAGGEAIVHGGAAVAAATATTEPALPMAANDEPDLPMDKAKSNEPALPDEAGGNGKNNNGSMNKLKLKDVDSGASGTSYSDGATPMTPYGTNTGDHLAIMSLLRQRVMKKVYKYPRWCRHFGVLFIIFWTILAALITSVFCIYFDVHLQGTNEYEEAISSSNCPDTQYDIPESVFLNYNATRDLIVSLEAQDDYTPYNPPEYDNLWEGQSASLRFIYEVLLTYLISVLITQPLILFVKSILKYFSFRRNPHGVGEALLLQGTHETAKLEKLNSTSKFEVEMGKQ